MLAKEANHIILVVQAAVSAVLYDDAWVGINLIKQLKGPYGRKP